MAKQLNAQAFENVSGGKAEKVENMEKGAGSVAKGGAGAKVTAKGEDGKNFSYYLPNTDDAAAQGDKTNNLINQHGGSASWNGALK